MGTLGRRVTIRRKQDRGQSSVEFLLTILFLILFIVGILEVILMVYTYDVLADAAKEGVRYAIVHGCDTSSCSGTCGTACTDATNGNPGGDVQTQVKNWAKLSFHDVSGMNVLVTYPDTTSDAPNRVRVAVSYPFKPLFGLGWPNITVNAAAEGRIAF